MITPLLAVIASVFTVAGYVSSATNAVNIHYDQTTVQQSLNQMDETQKLLREKALNETDPIKKAQKLAIANKLNQTHDKLSTLQTQLVQKAVKKEVLGLTKALATGVNDAVAVTVSGADTVIGLKSTSPNAVDDVTLWRAYAKSGDGLDVAIAKVKTRQLLSDTKKLNNELASMVQALQNQEKAKQIDNQAYEHKLITTINNHPELKTYVSKALVGLDTPADFDNQQANENPPSPTATTAMDKPSDSINSNSIVGTWKIVIDKGEPVDPIKAKLRYHFKPDGNLSVDGDIVDREYYYTYTLDDNGFGTFTSVGNNHNHDTTPKTYGLKLEDGKLYLCWDKSDKECHKVKSKSTRILEKISNN